MSGCCVLLYFDGNLDVGFQMKMQYNNINKRIWFAKKGIDFVGVCVCRFWTSLNSTQLPDDVCVYIKFYIYDFDSSSLYVR